MAVKKILLANPKKKSGRKRSYRRRRKSVRQNPVRKVSAVRRNPGRPYRRRAIRRNPKVNLKQFFGQISLEEIVGGVGGIFIAGLAPTMIEKYAFKNGVPGWYNAWVSDGIALVAGLGSAYAVHKFLKKPKMAKAVAIGSVATVAVKIIRHTLFKEAVAHPAFAGINDMQGISQELLLPTSVGEIGMDPAL